MPTYVGRNSAVGFGVESTWGTAVSRTHWYRLVSASVKREVSKVGRGVLNESTGSANRRSHYISSDFISATVEILVGYEGLGLLLQQIVRRAPSTTGPSGSIYTHVFHLGVTDPVGLTMEVIAGTGSAQVYEGCVITKAVFKIEAGGLMRLTLDLIGETSGGETGAGTPSYTTSELEVLHHQAGTISFNSVNYTAKSLTWTVDHKLARRQLLGSKLTKQPLPSDFADVMLDVELEYDSDSGALHAALSADTQGDATITFTGASSRTFTVLAHNAYLESVDQPQNTVGVLPLSARFRCESDGTDEGLKITVQNTQSSATAA